MKNADITITPRRIARMACEEGREAYARYFGKKDVLLSNGLAKLARMYRRAKPSQKWAIFNDMLWAVARFIRPTSADGYRIRCDLAELSPAVLSKHMTAILTSDEADQLTWLFVLRPSAIKNFVFVSTTGPFNPNPF